MSERTRWLRVDAVLEQALATPPPERAAFLDRECAGDADLRAELESLLRADAQAGSFLDSPLARPPAAEPKDLDPGTVLAGRYRVVGPIGRGGMGAVYRARDLVLDTDVAVKTLDPRLFAGAGRLEALRREVRTARRVTHEGVCRVHDLVEQDDAAFITMEYVDGESLEARLECSGPLPLAACRRVVAGVLRALAAAHAAGVVHRDLKPANVLLRRTTGEPVVVDFGVAVDAADAGAGRAGTRGYIAPEHLAGAPPDARSDLYALGVLMHRLATGALPGEDAVRPLPSALAPLTDACLQADPAKRPRDARAALALLEPGGGRTGRPIPWRLVAAIVGTAGALAVVRPWRIARTEPVETSPTLAVVDTAALAPSEAWLGEAFRRLVVEDAMDAWAIEVRAPPAAAVPAGAVRSRLWRDAAGGLRATLAVPPGAPRDLAAPSLRSLAGEAARTLAVGLAPADARHPTAQELREVGAHDPEAWRQFRRARRAARMEHWDRVRALARDAVVRDPDFPLAWLEQDLTYNREDPARAPLLDKVIELGDRAPGLSPLSRLAVEFGRASRRGDAAGVARALQQIAALELEGQDLLYVRFRLASLYLAQGEPEKGLPLLEWMAEKWPQDAAAPKQLADHYLGYDEPVSVPLALRYARVASALAPEDVAARANLGRALLLSGDEAGARAALAVIAGADPEDKQAAFLGERANRLFALHMALGDVEEAAADARRMGLEPGLRRAQGQVAGGQLDLARGAFDDGLRALAAAATDYERLDRAALAQDAYWQRAWQAWHLGRDEEVRDACALVRARLAVPDDTLSDRFARRTEALCALARLPPGSASADAVTAVRRRIAALPTTGDWARWPAYFELLVRHRQRDWPGVIAAFRELDTAAPPLPVMFHAADALDRAGRGEEARLLFLRLAAHPYAWYQPYRRGQAWQRAGLLLESAGDREGARAAAISLLRQWDRAPRHLPEVRDAQRLAADRRARSGSSR